MSNNGVLTSVGQDKMISSQQYEINQTGIANTGKKSEAIDFENMSIHIQNQQRGGLTFQQKYDREVSETSSAL